MKTKSITRFAAVLLALAGEKKLSAYEMLRILQRVNIQRWFPISDSSVYVTARNLEKQSLLEGEIIQEGNMPEKTVFSLTARGKDALDGTLRRYLCDTDAGNPEFDIAMLFLCSLPRQEALSHLSQKETRLIAEIDRAAELHKSLKNDRTISFSGKCMIRHNRYLKEAELKTVRELIADIKDSKRWDFFVTKDVSEEKEN